MSSFFTMQVQDALEHQKKTAVYNCILDKLYRKYGKQKTDDEIEKQLNTKKTNKE